MGTESYRNLKGEEVTDGDVMTPPRGFSDAELTRERLAELGFDVGSQRVSCGSLRVELHAKQLLGQPRSPGITIVSAGMPVDYDPTLGADRWEITG